MGIKVRPDGPLSARVMVVGEAPGEEEERRGVPFCGASGYELNRMLQEAGINRSECFVTNVIRERPFKNDLSHFIAMDKNGKLIRSQNSKLIDHSRFRKCRDLWVTQEVFDGLALLQQELALVKPNVVVAVGNAAMWALTGKWGVSKWRGSMLQADANLGAYKVIPTYHPAAVLRQWTWRAAVVHDLRRAARFRNGEGYPVPRYNFILRPSYAEAIQTLDRLIRRADNGERLRLAHDIETRAGHIACYGIAWSRTDAICIPIMCVERAEGYWDLQSETEIVLRIRRLLTHPQVEVIGQNHSYDSQYTDRFAFFVPNLKLDTMIGQHALFADLPKALYFLASIYCDYYVYWKDEGKNWEPGVGEEQLWHYNCLDCTYDLEIAEVMEQTVESFASDSWPACREVFAFQQRMFWPVLKAMQRGIRVDTKRRNEMILEVQYEIDRREQFIFDILGHPLNPDSPKQMHELFYGDFKMPVQLKRGKKGEPSRPTLDDDALQKLVRIEPLLKPLVNSIADIRTLRKFLSNFLCRPLDIDSRMRCAINIGGSESGKSAPNTYRLSTSENAFGSGTNMQNIPSEKSKSVGKAKKRGGIQGIGDPYEFPNIREIFVPDPGYTWFDMDLERADLYVFVWELEDQLYKDFLVRGVDAHLFHAYILAEREPPALDELCEVHPNYHDHRASLKHAREFAKVFTHAVDYVGGAPTIAKAVGLTVHAVDRARKIYLSAHPKIEPYWKKVENQIRKYHFIENKFGYRRYLFDRVESLLSEAVAWVPQSTVSLVINRIWERIDRELPEVQILNQVHDSLPGQFPTRLKEALLPRIKDCARIVIPYEDPLVIPISIKTSELSWGHC